MSKTALTDLRSKMQAHAELSGRGGFWFVVAQRPPSRRDADTLGVAFVPTLRQLHDLEGGLVFVDSPAAAAKVNRGRDAGARMDIVVWVVNPNLISNHMPDVYAWRAGAIRL